MKKHSLESSQNTPDLADSARIAKPPKMPKACGCSGVRWCRGCIDPQLRRDHKMDLPLALPEFLHEPPRPGTPGVFEFDPETGKAPGCPDFDGLCVIPDFLSSHEATQLLGEIESRPFALAQSGKQKQHFGAKVNFNKKKLNTNSFRGLPRYAKPLEANLRSAFIGRVRSQSTRAEFERFQNVLSRFVTTDLFVLRYQPGDASNLDFHIDDNFAYGEAIIDLSPQHQVIVYGRTRQRLKVGYVDHIPVTVLDKLQSHVEVFARVPRITNHKEAIATKPSLSDIPYFLRDDRKVEIFFHTLQRVG